MSLHTSLGRPTTTGDDRERKSRKGERGRGEERGELLPIERAFTSTLRDGRQSVETSFVRRYFFRSPEMDCETVGRCREQGEFLGRGSDFHELWKNGTRSCTWSTPTGPTQPTCGKGSAGRVTSAEFQLVTCGEEGRGDARRTGGAAKMQNVSSVAPSLRSDGIPARHTFPEGNLRFLLFLRPRPSVPFRPPHISYGHFLAARRIRMRAACQASPRYRRQRRKREGGRVSRRCP